MSNVDNTGWDSAWGHAPPVEKINIEYEMAELELTDITDARTGTYRVCAEGSNAPCITCNPNLCTGLDMHNLMQLTDEELDDIEELIDACLPM